MDTVLSYHDVLLRHDDLLLLREPNWLNDQVLLSGALCKVKRAICVVACR